MVTNKDLFWLAGLLEGEGCFTWTGAGEGTPRIILGMTDLDVVLRAKQIMSPNSKLTTSKPKSSNSKESYSFSISGKNAASWMMTIFSLMGSRRQDRIFELITSWKQTKLSFKDRTHCPRGHKYTEENIYRPPSNPNARNCRTCMRNRYNNDN